MIKKRKQEKGQSLFEVVISLAVISVIIISLVFLATSSIKNTTFSKTKTLSARLSQEAVEWLRGERDTSWDDFYSYAGVSNKYCLTDLTWINFGPCSDTEFVDGTNLKRELTLTIISSVNVEAEVETSWEDGDGVHVTRVVTNFTDWNK